MGRKRIDIESLSKEICKSYLEEKKPISIIAKSLNCEFKVIKKILLKNNIKLRSISYYKRGIEPRNKCKFDESEIIKSYQEGRSLIEISKGYNCSITPIYRILKKNNIIRRPIGFYPGHKHLNSGKTRFKKDFTPWNKEKKGVMPEPWNKKNLDEKEIIRLYIEEKKDCKEIAQIFKHHQCIIRRILRKYNLIRTAGESLHLLYKEGKLISPMKGKTGELSPNWLGGKSFEPYSKEFNKQFKKFIKERDGGCMLCNISFDDLKLLKRQIHVHHIDYNKLNSFPQNCVCLCNYCHSKTNSNRIHWIKFFQSLLKERYNYEYTENQEILFKFGGKHE